MKTLSCSVDFFWLIQTEGQEQLSQFVRERLLSSAISSRVERCFTIGGSKGKVVQQKCSCEKSPC